MHIPPSDVLPRRGLNNLNIYLSQSRFRTRNQLSVAGVAVSVGQALHH